MPSPFTLATAASPDNHGVLPALALFSVGAIMATGVIVMAFLRRTTGWIAAGSAGGFVLVLPILLFLGGWLLGTLPGGARMEVRATDAAPTPALQRETIQGSDPAYSFTVPAGWTVKRSVEAYDLLAVRKSLYVGVIAEEASGSKSEEIAQLARERIETVGTEMESGEATPEELDGRSWLQFQIKCRMEGIPLAYQFYVYAGTEGTFQIIGWTSPSLFERDAPVLQEVMKTFRFPKREAVVSPAIPTK